ncbi:MAG TPA: prepilin-type N-terminal cleavage/methylation domain-containing protein [Phycisphaerae bacterium]|jgi:prepilin-type N-terminal cleavage/methylation domain-containing protein/prepilin-type processing-associated H-X9-DG protein|nr:prepilin-type N-terminal cleavage/methylation domain-containing protein [Phycisphaerae bacterium]HOB74951.1 prepilin-type N-terminal cleavage/methylation domain-containing protein [Phycisphaerae bacterium]HOJ55742.1 prepilin-type N-terminal cleavage/methylation domain-containing protein [Phycisphaerae bacterium]HOL25772.1 prepilin-type N-terminal cleavage/methylation domain-containing protein [Phycisphaerae bacterium]HPP19535.1 prepilin-type N-terminal cleavage/methylation domain-containing 
MARKAILRQAGFTLIEVLVVVAIIALLVSILLPSLAKAKEQARSTVCSSSISQIGKACGMYTTEQKEWIPGSPLTTGYYWVQNYGSSAWDPSLPGFNRFVVEWFDFATPLRALMHGPRSIPKLASAQATRNALLKQVTEEPFHCPSNPHRYGPYGGAGPTIRATSYLTMSTIVRGGPGAWDQYSKVSSSLANDVAQSSSWGVAPPSSYLPKLSRLGRMQVKVFVADGLRFVNDDGQSMDYNIQVAATKGFNTADPPCTAWPYGREYNFGAQYSYRHGGNKNRMNAGFFDGHVESLPVVTGPASTAFRGRAIEPQYYYPSGSVVNTPSELHKSSIPQGTKLP